MSQPTTEADNSAMETTGAYEVLTGRLRTAADDLGARAAALNEERLAFFGSSEMRIDGSERIRTENNTVPRDIVAVGDLLLFGYNVFTTLKTHTGVADVLALHTLEKGESYSFPHLPDDDPRNFLADSTFVRDFDELYSYYKDARLLDLRVETGKLLAAFQTGARLSDVRVFRWSVSPRGEVTYLDNRGERDYVFPDKFGFDWTLAGRTEYVLGRNPYVDVLDEVFVDPRGGTLDFRVEDGTERGKVILSEPVDARDQDLIDCTISYVRLGVLVLLRILPYQETLERFFVYNTRTRTAQRLDAIGQSCQTLPEDHGIIFPGGYYLQDGSTKSFDVDTLDMEFETEIRSPNGEDVLYVFHRRDEGRYILLSYNMIKKEVATPVICHGASIFPDGTMVVFREDPSGPSRVHTMQAWVTPFHSDEYAAAQPVGDSFLAQVGNADLVRGISDALSLKRLANLATPSTASYEDLVAGAQRMQDAYHWLGSIEAHEFSTPLEIIRATSELVLDEFEKVQELRREASSSLAQATADVTATLETSQGELTNAGEYISMLATLRRLTGRLVTLESVRYIDTDTLTSLSTQVQEGFALLAERTVTFLASDESFGPLETSVQELAGEGEAITKVAEAAPVLTRLEALTGELELLTEVVSGLEFADATIRTTILERVGHVLSGVNRARALTDNRRRTLASSESAASFSAEMALFSQSVSGSLAQATTPERADEQLARVMVTLENMETTFGEFDEYVEKIAAKRDEVYSAFTSRKQTLLDERSRRAERLTEAARRSLDASIRRASQLANQDEVNAFFASDPLVLKVTKSIAELREITEPVRADELAAALKAAREDAARSLRDRTDLFEDGGEVVRLGRHRFSVNTSPLELTANVTGERFEVLLSGTDYRHGVSEPRIENFRPLWGQQVVSETQEVYRAEYLAVDLLTDVLDGKGDIALTELEALPADELVSLVRRRAESRFDEGYERGVHDSDAALILGALVSLRNHADLLRYSGSARLLAQMFWSHLTDIQAGALHARARSLGQLRHAFGSVPAVPAMVLELAESIRVYATERQLPFSHAADAGEYLFEELTHNSVSFVVSLQAAVLQQAFTTALETSGASEGFQRALSENSADPATSSGLTAAWLEALSLSSPELQGAVPEVVAMTILPQLSRREVDAPTEVAVTGLLGRHPRIENGTLSVRLDEVLSRINRFRLERVPAFRKFAQAKGEVLAAVRHDLQVDELTPQVMSSFVRNQLIDKVYLPLLGDNLAKQIGAVGKERRTDQMGLLLLISPPGYGKTTLMEYVAARLGMVFVKVNGPALGHDVTSLDPAEAPSAPARREVERINFALEAANNVMLYLDDIQHTNPELLQKFISLADATRRAEGVWEGESRTYDLRGKRFAICMAGNPYTESGEKFRIPDMLANRADTYNLGEVLSGHKDLFSLSYLENSLTANPTLAPLSGRDPGDVLKFVAMAQGEPVTLEELSHPYSALEVADIVSVLQKLLTVQELLLKVNAAYIASAAQADAYRTEPPFLLQGSYRNMSKLAAKIVPVLSEDELQQVLTDHYAAESQTLTSGTEQNLLKLAQLRGNATPEQQSRWDEICATFVRRQELGDETDPQEKIAVAVSQVSAQLGNLGSILGGDMQQRSTSSKSMPSE